MIEEQIELSLSQALVHGGPMSRALFEDELADTLDDLTSSMVADADDFILSVTADGPGVAMVLVERAGRLHVNEDARERLKALWPAAYESNLRMLTRTSPPSSPTARSR